VPHCQLELLVVEPTSGGEELVDEAIALRLLLCRPCIVKAQQLIGRCHQYLADPHEGSEVGLSVARDVVAIASRAEAGSSGDLGTCEIELPGSSSQLLPQNLHANMVFLLPSTVSMSDMFAIVRTYCSRRLLGREQAMRVCGLRNESCSSTGAVSFSGEGGLPEATIPELAQQQMWLQRPLWRAPADVRVFGQRRALKDGDERSFMLSDRLRLELSCRVVTPMCKRVGVMVASTRGA
jgi:hypothetical protein